MDTMDSFLGVSGARAYAKAYDPGLFVRQHLEPLLMERTVGVTEVLPDRVVDSEEQFWTDKSLFSVIRLPNFTVTDWFPRTPGVFWSPVARQTRRATYNQPTEDEPGLGRFYAPMLKVSLIGIGGIGSVRLRPRNIDGDYCWLGTAVREEDCHAGIPVAIPEKLLESSGMRWGERAELVGRIRFLQDAGLEEVARQVHGNRPLIVKVEKITLTDKILHRTYPVALTPTVLFDGAQQGFTFVRCQSSSDDELDEAADWMGRYAQRYGGRVVTNFDEQLPRLADAPLSYQRLVEKTYDKTVINQYLGSGSVLVQRVEHLHHEEIHQEVRMGHTISTGDNAMIAIDSPNTRMNQTQGAARELDAAGKQQLEQLVARLRDELETLKASHAEEVKEIGASLDKVVSTATKPEPERKKSFINLTAGNLLHAAELVDKAAPTVMHLSTQIANFVQGLVAS